ncbi:polysaccharide biosynthesis/export family protein [Candidatus Omnitrophota bacterium]
MLKKVILLQVLFLSIVCFLPNFIAGAAQESQEVLPAEVDVDQGLLSPIVGEAKPYTLGKEDVLKILVQTQPEFSGLYVIGPDGNIQYSFLGDIKAEGLTKQQLKQVLAEELEQFVKVPIISVAISEYRSKIVYILGEVYRPGKYPMKGDTLSLRDAIVYAGLPTRDAALRRSYVFKSDTDKVEYRKIDLFKVLYRGRPDDNIDLVPGDIVVVPSTIPSEINRALGNILSPFSRARNADMLLEHRWGVGDTDNE